VVLLSVLHARLVVSLFWVWRLRLRVWLLRVRSPLRVWLLWRAGGKFVWRDEDHRSYTVVRRNAFRNYDRVLRWEQLFAHTLRFLIAADRKQQRNDPHVNDNAWNVLEYDGEQRRDTPCDGHAGAEYIDNNPAYGQLSLCSTAIPSERRRFIIGWNAIFSSSALFASSVINRG
jgi:hypothetical protein